MTKIRTHHFDFSSLTSLTYSSVGQQCRLKVIYVSSWIRHSAGSLKVAPHRAMKLLSTQGSWLPSTWVISFESWTKMANAVLQFQPTGKLHNYQINVTLTWHFSGHCTGFRRHTQTIYAYLNCYGCSVLTFTALFAEDTTAFTFLYLIWCYTYCYYFYFYLCYKSIRNALFIAGLNYSYYAAAFF